MSGIFFAEPRLAEIYDVLHPDRSDLDPYLDIVDELGATSVLDLGCGTGTFACLLADRGKRVVAADPAGASIAVARRNPGAERVEWIVGDIATLPDLKVDMVTMTGNVGEHLGDHEWSATLDACRAALLPGGHLVFGARNPAGEGWRQWNRESTFERVNISGGGAVQSWLEITDAGQRHFTFRWTFMFENDGTMFNWNATFVIRRRDEIIAALEASSLTLVDVLEDEFIFVARVP